MYFSPGTSHAGFSAGPRVSPLSIFKSHLCLWLASVWLPRAGHYICGMSQQSPGKPHTVAEKTEARGGQREAAAGARRTTGLGRDTPRSPPSACPWNPHDARGKDVSGPVWAVDALDRPGSQDTCPWPSRASVCTGRVGQQIQGRH